MPSQWVVRKTRENDTLAKLASGYGVSAREIVEQNGLHWAGPEAYVNERLVQLGIPAGGRSLGEKQTIVRENDINEWVLSRGGRCLPGAAAKGQYGTPVVGCQAATWAIFTSDSEILLPNKERKDKVNTAVSPADAAKQIQASMRSSGVPAWAKYAAMGVGGVVLVAMLLPKKKRK